MNLYGSTRNYSILEEHSHLNEGLSEGVSFRGRLLVSLKTEILDSQDIGPSMVELETTLPVSDVGWRDRLSEHYRNNSIQRLQKSGGGSAVTRSPIDQWLWVRIPPMVVINFYLAPALWVSSAHSIKKMSTGF